MFFIYDIMRLVVVFRDRKIMSFSMKLRKVIYNLFFWLISIYAMWLILFKLATDFTTIKIIWAGPIAGMAALLFAALKIHEVLFNKNENEKLKEEEKELKKGFFNLQKKDFFLTLLSSIVACPLIYKFLGASVAICFLVGSIVVYIASFLSSLVSLNSSTRANLAAKNSSKEFHKTILNGGISSFLIPVGFNLIAFPVLYFIFKDPSIIMGFTFGTCLEAFLLVNLGEIFSNAAKILNLEKPQAKEADIIGKSLNAKNKALDVAITLIAILTGTIINGLVVLNLIGAFLPMTLVAVGVFCTMIASLIAKTKFLNSKLSFFTSFVVAIALYLGISYYLIEMVFMPDYGLFYPVATGVLTAIVIAIAGYFNLRIKKDELQNYKKEESNVRSYASVGIPLLIAGFSALAAFVNAGGMESYTAGFWGLGLSAISILSVIEIMGAISNASDIKDGALLNLENEEEKNIISEVSPALTMYGVKSKVIFSICSIYACLLLVAGLITTINLEEVDSLNPFVMYAFIFGAGVSILPVGLVNGSFIKAVKKIFKKESIESLDVVKILSNKGFLGSILPSILVCTLPLFSFYAITKLFERALGLQTLIGVLFGAIVAGGVLAIISAAKKISSAESSNLVSNLAVKLTVLSVLLVCAFLMPAI